MAFALEDGGATAPEWPHVVCAGSGWAWHEEPRLRACFVATVSAPAQIVSAALGQAGNAPIDRLLAIGALNENSNVVLERVLRIFRDRCGTCGSNHRELALQTLRILRHIHPGAVPALRKAMVPERRILHPHVHDREIQTTDPAELEKLLADARVGKRVKRLLRTADNLPVWPGEPERTRVAQIAFARQYALKNRIGVSPSPPLRDPIRP